MQHLADILFNTTQFMKDTFMNKGLLLLDNTELLPHYLL